jgi:sugar/nucleoside kinase (ribokinase family)
VILCALGDLMLDLVSRLERPIETGDDVPAETRLGAGGQAANVAAWAASLGATARLIARAGDDGAGRLVSSELRSRGVELLGPATGRNGVVVSLVDPSGERSLVSDPGQAAELRAEDLRMKWFEGCDALFLSGYSLLRRPIDEAGAKAAGAVHAQGGRVAVDLSSWTAIRGFGVERFLSRLDALRPDVVFAGERELAELGTDPQAATLVVKRGADGVVVTAGGERIELAAKPAEVVDTTGAGDALAAGFLVGGAELGLEAAVRCVRQMGAMP